MRTAFDSRLKVALRHTLEVAGATCGRPDRFLRGAPRLLVSTLFGILGILLSAEFASAQTNSNASGKAAKPELPQPRSVTPGVGGQPPSDAIVLFDGKNLAAWRGVKSNTVAWKFADGCLEVVPGTGFICTRQEFADVQLHVEWATPAEVKGQGQGRGNSGVFLMGRYEIQVLDSFQNPTYPDGQAGAFYGHAAPLVNASRGPGEWQSYDIIFHAPKTQSDGVTQPGSFTVLHNGVLVQDHVPVALKSSRAAPIKSSGDKGPLCLQDHRNPVRYRNIWVREL